MSFIDRLIASLSFRLSSGNPVIGTDTASGSDTKSVSLSGATGTTSVTRTAAVTVNGNQSSGAGGLITLQAGGVNNATIDASLQDINTNSGQAFRIKDGNFNASMNFQVKTALSGALSGASVTLTNFIPAGALVWGVTVYVNTLITGAASFQVGDGTTVNKWGAAVGLTVGQTNPATGWTSAGPFLYTTAANVVLTANTANFTAGNVRVTLHYSTFTSPNA